MSRTEHGKHRQQYRHQQTREQIRRSIRAGEPVFFRNSGRGPSAQGAVEQLNPEGPRLAADRFHRAEGLLAELFPNAEFFGRPGCVESPLRFLATFTEGGGAGGGAGQDGVSGAASTMPPVLAKCDHALPIAGSIKARGGIHEVLCHAEHLACRAGIISAGDELLELAGRRARAVFAEHELAVGSTGNLGLSIGITARALGFRAVIHMSRDAKQWKKDLLRAHGAELVEHGGDFSAAVAAGRAASERNPHSYFVDDENSERLLYGYAAAARPLRSRLAELGIVPSVRRPLCVYLPCGVGGGPAGIAYGLVQEFGLSAVEVFTVEPTQAPAVLIAVLEKRFDGLHVREYGLTLNTEADGLAVGSASLLAAPVLAELCTGLYTETDSAMTEYLDRAYRDEGLRIELSAAAGLGGPAVRAQVSGLPRPAAHVVWLTGGGLLPGA